MGHAFAELPERGAWRLTGAHEGFELVRFRVERERIVLAGTSVGIEDGVPWDLRYVIELDPSWRTRRAVIDAGDGRRMEIARDGPLAGSSTARPLAASTGASISISRARSSPTRSRFIASRSTSESAPMRPPST